jgi:nucleotide-binding universal stress UspA family protein
MNKFLLEPQANNHQHMERHHGGHGRTVSDAVLLLDNQSLVMVLPHSIPPAVPPLNVSISSSERRQHISEILGPLSRQVKTTSYDLEKVCTWVMATDHSHHSQAAFALLTRRMAKPGDKVLVVHVHGQAKDEYVLRDILEVYDSAIQKSQVPNLCPKPSPARRHSRSLPRRPSPPSRRVSTWLAPQVDGSVTALEGSGSINPGEMIVDFCKEHEADFVVVGIAGSGRAPRMGSVSEYITRMARCSVVVIKDPRDFSSHM